MLNSPSRLWHCHFDNIVYDNMSKVSPPLSLLHLWDLLRVEHLCKQLYSLLVTVLLAEHWLLHTLELAVHTAASTALYYEVVNLGRKELSTGDHLRHLYLQFELPQVTLVDKPALLHYMVCKLWEEQRVCVHVQNVLTYLFVAAHSIPNCTYGPGHHSSGAPCDHQRYSLQEP